MPPTEKPGENSLFSDPKAIKPLLAAFEAVCRSVRILGPNDLRAENVALMIVEAAKSGERDPERLCDVVLRALHRA
jgi:hypothetical protein